MTTEEDIARVRLSLAVDNTEHRQLPFPTPWYERGLYLAALVVAVVAGMYIYAVLMLSFG